MFFCFILLLRILDKKKDFWKCQGIPLLIFFYILIPQFTKNLNLEDKKENRKIYSKKNS